MRQALHIFKKDIRYLWYEVAMTLVIVAMLAFNMWVSVLLTVAWCYLTARLIYAEPLPGDRLFWITRPYAWKSLLAAKALFLMTFVTLPMIAADFLILFRNGFGGFEYLAGVLWSQLLIAILVVLPVVVIATITRSLVQLVCTTLLLLVAAMILSQWSYMHVAVPDWQGLWWIRYSFLMATVVLAGVIIVVRQYAWRKTAMARTLAVGSVLLLALEATFLPWNPAFMVQSWLSKQRIDAASVQIALDRDRTIHPSNIWPAAKSVWITFPIRITGLADGIDTRSETVLGTVEPSGAGWRAGISYGTLFPDGGDKYWLAFQLGLSSFERMKSQPVTVRTSLYLTLLGNAKFTTVPRGKERITVPGVGRCAVLADTQLLHCVSAFRDPMSSVSMQPSSRSLFMVARPLSYSPYPAEFGVSPVFQFFRDVNNRPGPIVIVSEEALAHFRKEAEFHDVRLADFAAPPPRE
jgi:hypothetical protein